MIEYLSEMVKNQTANVKQAIWLADNFQLNREIGELEVIVPFLQGYLMQFQENYEKTQVNSRFLTKFYHFCRVNLKKCPK